MNANTNANTHANMNNHQIMLVNILNRMYNDNTNQINSNFIPILNLHDTFWN